MKKPEPSKLSLAAERLVARDPDYTIDDRLLPIDVVMQIAGIGKTMIYRKVRDGTFPRPCKPGGGSTRWSEREVREWRDKLLAERDAA